MRMRRRSPDGIFLSIFGWFCFMPEVDQYSCQICKALIDRHQRLHGCVRKRTLLSFSYSNVKHHLYPDFF